MSTNLVCFLFGVPTALVWLCGLKKGIMLGLIYGWVRRAEVPGRFWLCSAAYGALVCGLIVLPILSWFGLRD